MNKYQKRFHIWSNEEKEYLKKITPGHHYEEILSNMNKKFNYNFNIEQIKGAIARYKLNTGFNGRFEKGHTPANKGKRIIVDGTKKTWFKKGHIPANKKPVGTEIVNTDGYTLVKIAEPSEWKLKQQLIWEKHNGPIPKGHIVIFADRDKRNFSIDNLVLVSHRQLLIMNKNNLIKNNSDVTKSGLVLANLIIKISDKKGK